MALQIRRGTNSERLLIVPLPGELVYVTDYLTAPPGTSAVYVGDGSTSGGVPVAVTPVLAGTLAGNISLGGKEINGTGTISITGNISNTGNLTTNGNILGSGNISRTGNLTIVGDGSVSGNLSAGAFEGELIGSVFADDSSGPLVNAIDSSFKGSLLTINSPVNSRTISLEDNTLSFSTSDPDEFLDIGSSTDPLGIKFYINKPINLQVSISDPDTEYASPSVQFIKTSRGSNFNSPENIQQDDLLGGSVMTAYTNDTFNSVAGFSLLVAEDQTSPPTSVAPASWVWATGTQARDVIAGAGDPFDRSSMVFDSQGIFRAPILKVSTYDLSTPGDLPVSPQVGMIIFDTNTSEFKGYNGSGWVVLG